MCRTYHWLHADLYVVLLRKVALVWTGVSLVPLSANPGLDSGSGNGGVHRLVGCALPWSYQPTLLTRPKLVRPQRSCLQPPPSPMLCQLFRYLAVLPGPPAVHPFLDSRARTLRQALHFAHVLLATTTLHFTQVCPEA